MSTEKPREWQYVLDMDAQVYQKVHVIEHAAYAKVCEERDRLKNYQDEMINKTMALTMAREEVLGRKIIECDALKAERGEYVHEAEHFQNKCIDLDQANGMLVKERDTLRAKLQYTEDQLLDISRSVNKEAPLAFSEKVKEVYSLKDELRFYKEEVKRLSAKLAVANVVLKNLRLYLGEEKWKVLIGEQALAEIGGGE